MADTETEMKNITAKNLKIFVKYLEPDDIINKITPIIKSLVNDKHPYVRSKLSTLTLSSFSGQ
jgi:hypothetical protein